MPDRDIAPLMLFHLPIVPYITGFSSAAGERKCALVA